MAVAQAGPYEDLPAPDRVWRSSGRLADSRKIIYFDESPGLGRADFSDRRDLVPMGMPPDGPVAGQDSSPGGGLRWDPLLGEWVMFATRRWAARSCRRPGCARHGRVAVRRSRRPATT